jgi:hypothetical protein
MGSPKKESNSSIAGNSFSHSFFSIKTLVVQIRRHLKFTIFFVPNCNERINLLPAIFNNDILKNPCRNFEQKILIFSAFHYLYSERITFRTAQILY